MNKWKEEERKKRYKGKERRNKTRKKEREEEVVKRKTVIIIIKKQLRKSLLLALKWPSQFCWSFWLQQAEGDLVPQQPLSVHLLRLWVWAWWGAGSVLRTLPLGLGVWAGAFHTAGWVGTRLEWLLQLPLSVPFFHFFFWEIPPAQSCRLLTRKGLPSHTAHLSS